ncbi:MAG: tetratricopeptide repeat protein [Deltaproteobacteria bacterium]|nr:tetratricopeptide repeat protein [Deltaproteobacteria bacterium]
MGTRSLAWGVLVVLGIAGPMGQSAHADPKSDLVQKSKEAMEAYDGMDYDAAKKSLTQAIANAKKAKLDKDPALAKAYMFLAVSSFAGGDTDGTKAAFSAAVAIDPKIQIDSAYKQPELTKLLEAARKDAPASGGGTTTATGDGAECLGVKGFQHTIVDTGKGGTALPLEVLLGADVKPEKVSIQFRAKETPDYTEVKMTKESACKWTGAIPGAAMKGSLLFYYVAAYDGNNRVIIGKGSSGAPNTMDIVAGSGTGGGTGKDTEDPINGKRVASNGGGGSGNSGGSVSSGGSVGGGVGKKKGPNKVYLAVVGGTGFGYVTGNTEGGNEVKNCCVGNSLVVLTPELGFHVSPQLAIGVAGRIGLPIGANVDPPNAKHSEVAPGALVRVRYTLSATGEGVRVMGQIGGGVMRNTIKLDAAANGMDTDIVAQGPLLLGAGIGFTKKLGNNLAFLADISALAGIAVTDKLGTATLNTGVGGDLSLGLALGF